MYGDDVRRFYIVDGLYRRSPIHRVGAAHGQIFRSNNNRIRRKNSPDIISRIMIVITMDYQNNIGLRTFDLPWIDIHDY